MLVFLLSLNKKIYIFAVIEDNYDRIIRFLDLASFLLGNFFGSNVSMCLLN